MSIITTQLARDDQKKVVNGVVSDYQPDDDTRARISQISDDFRMGLEISEKQYREFNDLSLIDRISSDQKSFNAYQKPKSSNPDEAWHSNAIRPIVRNRIISIAAHITGALIHPQIFAQNNNEKGDEEAAIVMRDLMDWRNDQADYEKTFVYSVLGALVNPGAIIYTEWAKTMREFKEVENNDDPNDIKFKIKLKEDKRYSGPCDAIVPLDEFFIENIYEHDIQKQGFLIWRRYISWTSAKAKYGKKYDNFQFVKPGIQTVFSEQDNSFYDVKDEDLNDDLVEEVLYWNQDADLHLIWVNGVLLTHPDSPNQRLDKKYPFIKFGYELYDEGRFFYFRSMAQKLTADEAVVNTLYRMIIDGTYMQVMPSLATYGTDMIDSSVLAPGRNTAFQDTNSRVEPINTGTNLNAGHNTLTKLEASISESSQDPLQLGQGVKGTQTAFEISRLEQNARIQLGLFGKMVAFGIQELGRLNISDVLQFMTVQEAVDTMSGANTVRFKKFLLDDRKRQGREVQRLIEFTSDMLPTDEEAIEQAGMDLLEREGGLEADQEIFRVNADVFKNLDFKIKVSPDFITPPSDNVKKAFNLEAFDRLIVQQEANKRVAIKELLLDSYEKTRDNKEEFLIQEASPELENLMTGQIQQPKKASPLNALASAQRAEQGL